MTSDAAAVTTTPGSLGGLGGVDGAEEQLGFVVSVPRSWYELELRPGVRDDAIRRLVEERTRGNDAMWEQRHAIRSVLLEQATQAWAAGAAYCAGFSLPTEEGPVTGSLTVSLLPDAGASLLSTDDRFRTVPRGTDPLEPYATSSVVDIPTAGRCARSVGISDTRLPDGPLLRHVFMLTAVPLPAHGGTFVVAASSPVVALADELLDLFDAVTGTFRVVRLDETRSARHDRGPAPEDQEATDVATH